MYRMHVVVPEHVLKGAVLKCSCFKSLNYGEY